MPSLSTNSIVLFIVLRRYGYGATSGLPATGYQVPPCTTPGHTTIHSTQYQSYVLQYITYVVRKRSIFYVLPSAEPSDSGCLQGADASATGFSENACQYPSLQYHLIVNYSNLITSQPALQTHFIIKKHKN